jgi:hypothetical protein
MHALPALSHRGALDNSSAVTIVRGVCRVPVQQRFRVRPLHGKILETPVVGGCRPALERIF